MEEKPADWGPPDQGEEGPLSPALTGFVLVLFNEPKGELAGSFSFSSREGPKPSLKSVLRLRSDGGGEETLDSSFENLLLVVGDVSDLPDCKRSPPDSRRRAPGRVEGELIEGFCEIEVRRFKIPFVGVPSLLVF